MPPIEERLTNPDTIGSAPEVGARLERKRTGPIPAAAEQATRGLPLDNSLIELPTVEDTWGRVRLTHSMLGRAVRATC